jgi:hypothetical protein
MYKRVGNVAQLFAMMAASFLNVCYNNVDSVHVSEMIQEDGFREP